MWEQGKAKIRPAAGDGSEEASSVSRSSSTTSSPMSTSSVVSAEQRCSRERHARRQPGWEKQERDRLERLIMEETKRVRPVNCQS